MRRWAASFVVTIAACTESHPRAVNPPEPMVPPTTSAPETIVSAPPTPSASSTAPPQELPKKPKGQAGKLVRRKDGTCWFTPDFKIPKDYCKPGEPCMPPNPPPPQQVECPPKDVEPGEL
jgi:hypothetical protein